MKCIKDGVSGNVVRVTDDEAHRKVTSYPAIWRYCPKGEWKRTLIRLAPAAQVALANMLINPPEPNAKLRAAAKKVGG